MSKRAALTLDVGLRWGRLDSGVAIPGPGMPGGVTMPCDPSAPLDVALVLDVTGSMRDALANVAAGAADIVSRVAAAGDYQLGLVTFEDFITVLVDMAAGTASAVQTALAGLAAGNGFGAAEASDEALSTAVNRLRASDRPAGPIHSLFGSFDIGPYYQAGDFTGVWRPEASKVAILVTDAPPAGFVDQHTPASDAHALAVAEAAAEAGIRIAAVFVPTTGNYDGQAEVMQQYAAVSGGMFVETAQDASDLAAQLGTIIDVRACSLPGPG